jgi:hypothetical protein
MRHDEPHITERDATVGCRDGTKAFLGEGRVGRCLVVAAHLGKVAQLASLEAKAVLGLPNAIPVALLHVHAVAHFEKTVLLASLVLDDIGLEKQRFEDKISEANIGEPRFVEINPQSQVIELGAVTAVSARNTGGEKRDSEAELPQQGCESSVHFVAESAAMVVNDLVKESLLVADDFALQADVKILEGNGEHVGAMKSAKGLQGGVGWALIGDAREIGGNVQVQTKQSTETERRTAVNTSFTPATALASTSLRVLARRSSRGPIFPARDAYSQDSSATRGRLFRSGECRGSILALICSDAPGG